MKKIVLSLFMVTAMVLGMTACTDNTKDKESTEKTVSSKWETVKEIKPETGIYLTGFYDASYGVSVGYAGKIQYTADGGNTWNQAKNTSLCRFGLELATDKVGYTCGNGGNVTKTTDGGATWTPVTDFGDSEPQQCKTLSFVNENLGMISSSKRLAITEDGAKTWKELTPPEEITGLRFISENKCYLIGAKGNLYLSTDKGQTWTKKEIKLPDKAEYKHLENATAISMDENGKGEFFCLNDDGVLMGYTTKNGGDTWTKETKPKTEGFSVIYLSKNGEFLSVNTIRGSQITLLKKSK